MTADHDRARFHFQQDWFELIRPEWEQRTAHLRGRELRVLEIGCFEGCSTTWILDNLMSHPNSVMTVIDTFEGGMEHQDDGALDHPTDRYQLSTLKRRFDANVAKCTEVAKLNVMQARSDDALVALRQQRRRFDFIYIDASHVAIDVLHDAVMSWQMLDQGGLIVFDDYSWRGFIEPSHRRSCIHQMRETPKSNAWKPSHSFGSSVSPTASLHRQTRIQPSTTGTKARPSTLSDPLHR